MRVEQQGHSEPNNQDVLFHHDILDIGARLCATRADCSEMNVIFLDFDGVLNSTRSVLAQLDLTPIEPVKQEVTPREQVQNATDEMKLKWHIEWDDKQWGELDRIAIGLIDKLCLYAPAKVVISSTWRLNTPHVSFHWRFWKMGFKNIQVIGKTPNLPNKNRGQEIQDWIRTSLEPVERFVIIDDDSDMTPRQKQSHFVQTNNNEGLLLEHYRRALEILNPSHPSLVRFPR